MSVNPKTDRQKPAKDGGPAFPLPEFTVVWKPEDDQWHRIVGVTPPAPGMSLRDWFAGQSLASLSDSDREGMGCEELAQTMYMQADAMIAEREKQDAE